MNSDRFWYWQNICYPCPSGLSIFPALLTSDLDMLLILISVRWVELTCPAFEQKFWESLCDSTILLFWRVPEEVLPRERCLNRLRWDLLFWQTVCWWISYKYTENQSHTKIETVINSGEIQNLFNKGHVIIGHLRAYSYVNVSTEDWYSYIRTMGRREVLMRSQVDEKRVKSLSSRMKSQ